MKNYNQDLSSILIGLRENLEEDKILEVGDDWASDLLLTRKVINQFLPRLQLNPRMVDQ